MSTKPLLLSVILLLLGGATFGTTSSPLPMVMVKYPYPDTISFFVWIGSQSRTTWVAACPTFERWGHAFERPPVIQSVTPHDFPDLVFSFWPADALARVSFAFGHGSPPSVCPLERYFYEYFRPDAWPVQSRPGGDSPRSTPGR